MTNEKSLDGLIANELTHKDHELPDGLTANISDPHFYDLVPDGLSFDKLDTKLAYDAKFTAVVPDPNVFEIHLGGNKLKINKDKDGNPTLDFEGNASEAAQIFLDEIVYKMRSK